jgi:hypothetical protein
MATWQCGADRDLPITIRGAWDGAAAQGRIFAWAGWDDAPDLDKARQAFLVQDTEAPALRGSYKLPFADVVDGELQAISSGLTTAAQHLPQADISAECRTEAEAVLEHYRQRSDDSPNRAQPKQAAALEESPVPGKDTVYKRGERLPAPAMPVGPGAQPGRAGYSIGGQPVAAALWSEPFMSSLAVRTPGTDAYGALTPARRRELRKQLAAGDLDELSFRAETFKALYPNKNFLRFRDEDLPYFADSYAGAPFLRDHNDGELDARGGIIAGSWLEDKTFVQDVTLTAPRAIEALLNRQIDRFSISWGYSDITCSICGTRWFSEGCFHWPGDRVKGKDGQPDRFAELIFEEPTGREVSAVNTPAVAGTGIRGLLAQLAAERRPYFGGRKMEIEMTELVAVPAVETAELLAAQREAVLDAKLAGSRLPDHLQSLVRASLRPGWRVAELDAAIEHAQGAWAALEAQRTVQNVEARVTGMQDSLDRITEALSALIEGRAPNKGVRPLSGVREAYLLLSGDYAMTGMFQPENVSLASVTSTTMANIVANVLNKSVVNTFQQYPRWWEAFCRSDNFNNLQTVQWITLGGIGALPTVAEGQAYTELAWDDSKETASWVKKGGYLGITLEAMDNDDVGRLRTAPQALAQAAWLTLGRSVSAIFTSASGLGPTMADNGTLFNATAVATPGGHANLLTAALSPTSLAAVKLAMRKQAEVNSGERLGGLTALKFLLIPPDMEQTALIVLASENMPGGANNDVNTEAEGSTRDARMAAARRKIIIVDFWTDTNNWAAVADPLMYPTIGIGYRFGQVPEIFSVASPNSGLMFSNDVMPIKVRWFYAVGPMDWRGLFKSNVS